MTVPFSAIPNFKALFNIAVSPSNLALEIPGNSEGNILQAYSLGRYAIKAAVDAYQAKCGSSKVNVWVPAYFCDESLFPLRNSNYNIRFYPSDEGLRPKWDWIESNSRKDESYLFLLVHYFGRQNDLEKAREVCSSNKWFLLDDAAHIVTPSESLGQGGGVCL